MDAHSFLQVRWVKQQVVKKRVKRDYLDMTEESSRPERSRASDRGRPSRRAGFSSARSVTYNLNDPRWAQMWYLVSLNLFLLLLQCSQLTRNRSVGHAGLF